MARIELRASDEDRTVWTAKAEAVGVTLSALIRQALSEAPTPRRRRRVEVDPALLRQLALIGNNLNQLARWANRDKQAVEARAVVARLVEIDRELAELRRSLEAGKEEDRDVPPNSEPSTPSRPTPPPAC